MEVPGDFTCEAYGGPTWIIWIIFAISIILNIIQLVLLINFKKKSKTALQENVTIHNDDAVVAAENILNTKNQGEKAMRYLYRVETIKINLIFGNDNKKQEAQLNAAGAQGWKLLLISEGKKYMKYVYVKEVL